MPQSIAQPSRDRKEADDAMAIRRCRPHVRRRSAQPRQRGIVLILVVAVLGILFVSGVALLTTVTFAAKNIEVQKADRQNRAAVRAIESAVNNVLRDGFLGTGGLPYNAATTNGLLVGTGNTSQKYRVNLPVYGEIPGLNTIISLTEPEEDGTECSHRFFTDLDFAMKARPGIDPFVADITNMDSQTSIPFLDHPDWNLTVLVPNTASSRRGFSLDQAPWTQEINNLSSTLLQEMRRKPWLRMDADGDGIPDSYAMQIGADLMSPDLRRALADRLRDPKVVAAQQILAASDPNFDSDALWLTLKVVPHGAMVNVNARLPDCEDGATWVDPLFASILGEKPQNFYLLNAPKLSKQPYLSESEEWAMRYRGGAMIPRSLAATRMMTDLTKKLLLPHTTVSGNPSDQQLLDATNRVWWQFDSGLLGKASSGGKSGFARSSWPTPNWRQAMSADDFGITGAVPYDLSHVLTTVSHDDQLIRSGVDQNGVDWVKSIVEDNPGSYSWDEYPAFLAGSNDPRLGRLKFSFPYFSKSVFDGGGLANASGDWGGTLDKLAPNDLDRLKETIQDAFLLLLRNYRTFIDFDQSGTIDVGDDKESAILAASLSANLIDFADNTPQVRGGGTNVERSHELSRVAVRAFDGSVMPGVDVYGLERQPYITEIYSRTVPGVGGTVTAQSSFAIELYNPYPEDIDLSSYYLVDLGKGFDVKYGSDTAISSSSGSLPRLSMRPLVNVSPPPSLLGVDSTNSPLPFRDPRRFGVFYGYGRDPAGSGSNYLEDFALDGNSRITLVREVLVPLDENNYKIVYVPVDRFDVWKPNGKIVDLNGNAVGDGNSTLGDVDGVGGQTTVVSIERDTSGTSSGSNWRFVVPAAQEKKMVGNGAGVGSVGEENSYEDPSIRSVHIDFTNTGVFRTSFPTTGTMLLMMRLANVVDPSDPDYVIDSSRPDYPNGIPFNHYRDILFRDRAVIDNGRMPVFDPLNQHHVPPSAEKGAEQGVQALPWGQLVFDYFTALPLESEGACECSDCIDCEQVACVNDPMGMRVVSPIVDQDGLRVSGRININAAPWPVLAGLPFAPMGDSTNRYGLYALPDALRTKIKRAVYEIVNTTDYSDNKIYIEGDSSYPPPPDGSPGVVGSELAKAIVAYRDARLIPFKGGIIGQSGRDDFGIVRGPMANASDILFRRGLGFLTVGELLNVRPPFAGTSPTLHALSIDRQALVEDSDGDGIPDGDYVTAVGLMVALGDWVTTKSHVFTVYGTIRGQFYHDANDANDASGLRAASLRVVDQKAIRFQTTVDRLPMLFGRDAPERIGSLIVERYSDLTAE